MGVNIQTIKDIRIYLSKELKKIYQEPEINAIAGIIIKTVTGLPKLHQLYKADHIISSQEAAEITKICEELKTGKPIQYVLGETVFYNCTIRLNNSTLIPRQETEELVDLIIRENRGFNGKIIDIGTGSGCIAIALAANMPGATVEGTDISGDAIRQAGQNATLNNVSVSFSVSDIFNFHNDLVIKAGIIVSNPPYVRNSEKQFMNRNVLDFEPQTALFVTDDDPLVYYKAILKASEKILVPGGKIYFEINEAMGQPMNELLTSAGFSGIGIVRDINQKDRIIKGRKNV
jgi:release factor glutamine methyltransferase